MAIDYSGYAQSYGGGAAAGAAGQTIGRGLARIPSFQERYGKYRKNVLDKTSTDPLMKFISTDLTLDKNEHIDLEGYKGSAASFADHAKALSEGTGGKGKFFGRRVENKGLVDARTFVDKHRANIEMLKPDVARQIYSFRDAKFKTNSEMKTWLAGKPQLRNFILNTYPEGDPNYGQLRAWAKGDESWKQWLDKKGFAGGFPGQGFLKASAMTAGVGIGGYSGYRAAKQGYNAFQMLGKGADLKTGQFNRLTNLAKESGLGGKVAGKMDTAAKKNLSSAKSTLTKAQNKFNKASKAYKGKNFVSTKNGKALNKSINAAKTAVSSADKQIGKATGNILKRAIDKHGSKKVVRMVARKLGFKGAVKFMAKLGLGGVMQFAPGVGMAASAVLLASDIALVYSIIKELAD